MPVTTVTGNSYSQRDVSTRDELNDIPRELSFDFEALSADDISVCAISRENSTKLDYDRSEYTVDLATKTLTINSTWQTYEVFNLYANSIRVFRTTTNQALVDFTAGAVLNENDLDLAYKQNLFSSQEMVEDAAFTKAGIQSVSEGVIETGAVTQSKIGALAVNNSKLAADAVTSDKIADDAVIYGKIAENVIGERELAPDSIGGNSIQTGAINFRMIASDAVLYEHVDQADKSEMEGQSAAGIVTPDVLKYSPFAPRAYGTIQYDTVGADSLDANSYNVDVTTTQAEDNPANTRKIYFDTDLDSASYTVLTTMEGQNGMDGRHFITEKNVGYFVIHSDDVPVAANRKINFVVFGGTLSS